MIKIITQQVYAGRGIWGYSLRVNGKFVKYTGHGNGVIMTSKDNATIWANLASLRAVWNRYMVIILHLAK